MFVQQCRCSHALYRLRKVHAQGLSWRSLITRERANQLDTVSWLHTHLILELSLLCDILTCACHATAVVCGDMTVITIWHAYIGRSGKISREPADAHPA